MVRADHKKGFDKRTGTEAASKSAPDEVNALAWKSQPPIR
jgi:hypothetical protein